MNFSNKLNLRVPIKVMGFVLTILFMYIVLFFLEIAGINMDYVGLITYILFLVYIVMNFRKMIVKYIYIFIMFTYHICSVFAVENYPTYLYNLQTTSYWSGAFIPLTFAYVIGFCTLIILENNKNSYIVNNIESIEFVGKRFHFYRLSDKQIVRIITAMLFVLLGFMLLRLRNGGYYSMGGVDRFEYRGLVFSTLDSKLYTYIAWFLPLPLLGNNLGMKKRAFMFFAIYGFYLIWVGDKFGSLFSAVYFYLLVSWATKKLDRKTFRRLLLLILAILGLLMIYIGYQVLYERGSLLEVFEYFHHRLTGGQSDLWWGIYSQEKDGVWRLSEFSDELKAMFVQPASTFDYNFGIYKMMKVTAPAWVVTNYLTRGVRFAASTQASLFYYFKYTGLFAGSILMFVLYFFLVNRAVYAYKRCDLIESVCYTMLLSKAIYLTTMSGVDMIGNATTILGIIILVLYKSQRNRRKYYFFKKERMNQNG